MIKAEAITHEGNPGPNWLDHCKTMITPGKVALVVVIASALIVTFALKHRSDAPSATASKQPTTTQDSTPVPLAPSQALQVEPLSTQSTDSSLQQQSNDLQPTTTDTTTSAGNTQSSSTSTKTTKGKSRGQGSSHASSSSAVYQTLQGVQQSLQQNVQSTLQGLSGQ